MLRIFAYFLCSVAMVSAECADEFQFCAPDIHNFTAMTWSGKYTQPSLSSIPRSNQGKILLMHNAYTQIINEIESQVKNLGSREARGSKGGMGSMEGALVTISLLTFAVYLIKLVMMLVNAVQNKKLNSASGTMASTVQPSGLQTFVLKPSRRKRNLDYQQFLVHIHRAVDQQPSSLIQETC